MKKSRYSESQIIQILNERESGIPIADLCREHGINRSAYYKWKAKYGGVNVNELKHLRLVGFLLSSLSKWIAEHTACPGHRTAYH